MEKDRDIILNNDCILEDTIGQWHKNAAAMGKSLKGSFKKVDSEKSEGNNMVYIHTPINFKRVVLDITFLRLRSVCGSLGQYMEISLVTPIDENIEKDKEE